MQVFRRALLGLAILILSFRAGIVLAQESEMRNYALPPLSAWSFLSDQVMGGVSEGGARIEGPSDAPYLRLTGNVSTANRGGFLQTRVALDQPFPKSAQGGVIEIRGNGEGYFIHLRSGATLLPWQYYQAPIPSGPDWQMIRVPFSAFKPSGGILPQVLRPESVKSLGVVAYGRDHQADVSFRWTGLY